MQQFSRPLALAKTLFCCLLEANIPEGPEYKKYQHYTDAQGEVQPTPHRNNNSYAASK